MKPIKTLLTTSLAVASFSSFGQDPVWDANTVVLTQRPLADGVFAYYPKNAKKLGKKGFPVATSGGFIVGDSGVLIIDTMLNKRLNSQVQSFVAEHSKPPKIYAVNTSYHGNHSYENMYLPESPPTIQHEVNKGYRDSNIKAEPKLKRRRKGGRAGD